MDTRMPVTPGDHGAIVPRDQSKEEQEQSALFVATQSSAPLAEIVGISFGLLNPAHARAMQSISSPSPRSTSKGKPPFGSVNFTSTWSDQQLLGDALLQVCRMSLYGRLCRAELAYPVYNPLFLDDN